MKKIQHFLLPLCLPLLYLAACNSSGKEEEKKNTETAEVQPAEAKAKFNFDSPDFYKTAFCESAGGMANFIIRPTEADSMKNHFDTIYGIDDQRRYIDAMRKNYFIDSCTLYAIASFLRSSKKHDGIRILFGCEIKDNPRYGGQQHKRETTLNIWPTKFRANPADPTEPSHDNDTKSIIPTTGCAGKTEFIRSFTDFNQMRAAFKNTYRKEQVSDGSRPKDSLSLGVWIDSCVIFYIEQMLKDNQLDLAGIFVRPAAYFTKQANLKSQVYAHQSTFILEPVSVRHGVQQPEYYTRPDIINELIKYLDKNQKLKFMPGGGSTLNHSQLCPNQCGTT
jgi:hypothetical protein